MLLPAPAHDPAPALGRETGVVKQAETGPATNTAARKVAANQRRESPPGGDTPASPQFELQHEIPFSGAGMPVTMIHDAGNRPFLHVAAKEAGLRIYDLKGAPRLVRQVPISDLHGLHAMSLTQSGQQLFLALGNHWGKADFAGLAVIDASDPAGAKVAGAWKDTERGSAGGDVVVNGGTAFLAAMGAGLIVLDISRPQEIRVRARIQPDLKFPDARPDRRKINARGLALRGNLLFLCYDAGGVRVLDVSDAAKLVEIGRYSNPAMQGRPRAYNHIVLDGTRAYVTADYVGMEVLDITDPKSIKLVSWWNPWNPGLEALRWFSSPGHANEIAYDARSHTVLMSAGRSDLVAVNVADPAKPQSAGGIGKIEDTQATWGIALHGDQVYLSYIRTLGVPFRADWAGVKIFRMRP
jgi:hypothetical protein